MYKKKKKKYKSSSLDIRFRSGNPCEFNALEIEVLRLNAS